MLDGKVREHLCLKLYEQLRRYCTVPVNRRELRNLSPNLGPYGLWMLSDFAELGYETAVLVCI